MWNDGGTFGGGGGFLDSSYASPSAEGGEKKKTEDSRAENVVPVTVNQILKSGDEFRVGQLVVRAVLFIGRVKNIDISSTKVTYTIDDFTGQIDAVLWLEGPVETSQPSLNSYVRVVGTVRVSQGKRYIMVFNIQPVTDMNDLTIHLLEVIDVDQNAPDFMDVEQSGGSHGTSVNKPLTNSMMNMNQIDDGLDQQAPSDPQQRMVFKVISDAAVDDEGGVDVQFITRKLNGRVSQDQVRSITDFLLHEGFIFSTIDDEHFTVTR